MPCKEIKYIHFVNNTDLPLMIDSWVDSSNVLQYIKINPREKVVLHSSVGEWHMNAMLCGEERKLWDDNKNLKCVVLIGKFRSRPCSQGEYSWLDWDDKFDCVYSELEEVVDGAKGVMTFSLSPLLNIDEVD
jgi:hypothetical protein